MNPTASRNPELMSTHDTGLLVIDVQQRLVPAIADHARVVWNIGRLIDGAKLLGMAVAGSEQYPRGLGPTLPELAAKLGPLPEKMVFSCRGCADVLAGWTERGIDKVLVVGIEAHVCVQQTVLDLMAAGWRAIVAVDAIGSRFPLDYQTALRRMESAGASLTTTEAALFEWCETADRPEFKAISQLVRQAPPQGQ